LRFKLFFGCINRARKLRKFGFGGFKRVFKRVFARFFQIDFFRKL
jgi:hypothetical protein